MKIFENIITKTKTATEKASAFFTVKKNQVVHTLSDCTGENYVDTAVKILIAVVLGGLLLAGLYSLFGEIVLPTLKSKIQSMFNYRG